MTTIPLWKSQIVIAIALFRQKSAVKMQTDVDKATNDLLLKNSEMLKQGSIEVAQANERGIIEIETLKTTNANLIETLESTIKIHEEGRAKRQAAETQLDPDRGRSQEQARSKSGSRLGVGPALSRVEDPEREEIERALRSSAWSSSVPWYKRRPGLRLQDLLAGGASGLEARLTYAKAEPLEGPSRRRIPAQTVDLGDGPVPLLTVPLDTWGGYAALFAANGGPLPRRTRCSTRRAASPSKLVHVEGATDQLAGYSAGQYPIIWASDGLAPPAVRHAQSPTSEWPPRSSGLFDWCAGGDGILAKSSVKTPADLKGKTILTSSNTPFAFFLLVVPGPKRPDRQRREGRVGRRRGKGAASSSRETPRSPPGSPGLPTSTTASTRSRLATCPTPGS